MSLPESITTYWFRGGLPTPIRTKYSPLPWSIPETTSEPNASGRRVDFPAVRRRRRAATLLASRVIRALNRVWWSWEVLKMGTLSLWSSLSLYSADEDDDDSVAVLGFRGWLEYWVGLSLVSERVCLTLRFWK